MAGHFDLDVCVLACQAICEDEHRERGNTEPSEAIIRVLALRYREVLERARCLLTDAGYEQPIPEPLWVTQALISMKGTI